MSDRLRVSVVGGSGYVGGELVRLLVHHPRVTLHQVTSASQAGRYVYAAHPNLRGVTELTFTPPDTVDPVDVLLLAQPHGASAANIDHWGALAPILVDTSADFRLRRAEDYASWYDAPHPAPAWLDRFVYGLPERYRDALRTSRCASGVGCNATAAILALAPLADAGLLARAVTDVKVGSSEGGSAPNAASHHPERRGAVRSFMPTGHRHQAEIRQALGEAFDLTLSVTGVELVRGVLATAHCVLHERLTERDLWQLYRRAYGTEPFVRLVSGKTGIHRYPEPKLLAGSNWCDIGFAVDDRARDGRVVVLAALDNLMKGAAGSAVQCLNLMAGFPETAGLGFPGLHPA